MTVAETSIQIYTILKKSGKLNQTRLQVFREIEIFTKTHSRPVSSYDIEGVMQTRNYSTVAARFGELVAMDLIKCVGTREISGANRKVYDITGNTQPKKLPKKDKNTNVLLLQSFENAIIMCNENLINNLRIQIIKKMK